MMVVISHADKTEINEVSVSCGYWDDYTYQAAPQLSYEFYLFLLIFRTMIYSSHAQNIEDGNFATLLAFDFNMSASVLVDSQGIMAAVGAF